MTYSVPNWLILFSGIGQIFTALIYPYIRHRVFDWYRDVKKLKPLNQEIAKTYGRYIQGLNFFFGGVALTLTTPLQNGSPLAIAFSGLFALYWLGKIITQIAYYPMYEIPQSIIFKLGSYLMNSLFVLFALVNTWLLISNITMYLNT